MEHADMSSGNLKVEWAVRPHISNREAIPLDAAASEIFPDSRTLAKIASTFQCPLARR